jgi:hypothetical protein
VQTFTVADGHAEIRTRPVGDADDDLACSYAEPIDTANIRRGGTVPPPITIYDPRYNIGWNTRVDVPAGQQVLVCVEIYPTDNPTRPEYTDRLVLAAPSQERPRIVLQAIRRLGSVNMRSSEISMVAASGATRRGDWDGCGGAWTNRDPLPAGETFDAEFTIWECQTVTAPVDASGRTEVVVSVRRDVDSGPAFDLQTSEVAIPIQLTDCRALDGCGRPREWYEIPIPTMDGRLCGTGFGSTGCGGEPPLDGIAVVRVEYPVIAGAETAATVRSIDSIVAGAPTGTPVVAFEDDDFVRTADPFLQNYRARLFADRPVRIRITTNEVEAGPCSVPPVWESAEFSTEFTVLIEGFCSGTAYAFDLHIEDEAGNVYDSDGRLWRVPSAVSTSFSTTIEILGGDGLPQLGYFYEVSAEIEGQTATAYWWDSTATLRGRADSCLGLTGTRFTSRGAPREIVLRPPTLYVGVRLNITTGGNGDCSGNPRDGLGVIEFGGHFTIDQLRTGEPLLLTSPDDARLRIAVRLTPNGDWR